MKNFGFSAAAQNSTAPARSSVVMEAGPTISGQADNKCGVDMAFFDKKFKKHSNEHVYELMENAKKLSTPGKGILATDESNFTIGLRLDSIGVDNTYENRIGFRSMLFRTPGMGEYFSGCIMFDETARATDEVSGKTTIALL
jgi:hypothetical protein